MTISATQVKELRESTGAGMLDCKKALEESKGDIEAAVDWLRKKGLSAAAKKSGRVASEGLIGVLVSDDGKTGAVVEVNAETDFVSRNDEFQKFVGQVTKLAAASDSLEALQAAEYPGSGRSVADELTAKIATIGENMTLRRMHKISVGEGLVVSYIHNAAADNMGRIGVLVGLESKAAPDALAALGKQLAMHVAAAAPQALTADDLDPAIRKREEEVIKEQAIQSGKPPEIAEKMVAGRMQKFLREVVLMEQTSVIDGETQIAKQIETAAADAGEAISVGGFVRFNLGEGVAKEESDFAAEVAAQLK